MHTTNYDAILLRQVWERMKGTGRPFNVTAELATVQAAPPLNSTEVSRLEQWVAAMEGEKAVGRG